MHISAYGIMYFAESTEQATALMTNLTLVFLTQKIKIYFDKIIEF